MRAELKLPLSLRFTEQQIAALDTIVKNTGIPRNELIRRFIDEGIGRWLSAHLTFNPKTGKGSL